MTFAEALEASGLWASYGEAAQLLGYGDSARACATANWERNLPLARADGRTEASSPHQGEAWIEAWIRAHPEKAAIEAARGYESHDPKPQELRLDRDDLEALAGLQPPSVHLRLRVSEQALRLEEWLEANPAHPHRAAIEAAMLESKALVADLRTQT